MLTRGDETVADCLEVFDQVESLGLRHVGFKDVGVGFGTLARLNERIKAAGGTSYMEVVAPTAAGALESARSAARIGVDRLLGGVEIEPMIEALSGTPVAYYPFVGRPTGHPMRLGGTPAEIAAHTARARSLGCAGVDLLAYRATESDPLELIRAARRAMDGRLVVAGSIDSPARIRAAAAAGADAFTIGSAAFEGSFCPGAGLTAQLKAILETSAEAPPRAEPR